MVDTTIEMEDTVVVNKGTDDAAVLEISLDSPEHRVVQMSPDENYKVCQIIFFRTHHSIPPLS